MQTSFMINLAHLGLIKVVGSGAKQFLQGQLTCDLEEISSVQAQLGAHCNSQGRMISLFLIFLYQNNYYLQMPREIVPLTIDALKKYVVFFKVTLSDTSDALTRIGYYGNYLNDTVDACVMKLPGHPTRYEIVGEATLLSTLWKKLAAQSEIISAEKWKYFDIAANIPDLYPETSGKFLPHDINLPALKGVSFKKGCYTGQEIIARMHYRGKLKTHFRRITIESVIPPQRGSDIDPDNTIVDYCQTGYNSYELLVITHNR